MSACRSQPETIIIGLKIAHRSTPILLAFLDFLFPDSRMVEIIPSINVPTFEEAQERIAYVEPYVSWCHLDVTDGLFSKHPTWNDPRDLVLLQTKLKTEVHLMIQKPEEVIEQWLVPPIQRVIVHLEAASDPELIIKKCHEAGREVGFAINPETPWERFVPWFGKTDLFLPLGVSPGASGQQPDREKIIEKIMHIRAACPGCILEADGGVNLGNASQLVEVGANLLVAGSAIFESGDVGENIKALKRLP